LCETKVKATKFNAQLGLDCSYRTYEGGDILKFSLNTEDDLVYYLQDIGAVALNQYLMSNKLA